MVKKHERLVMSWCLMALVQAWLGALPQAGQVVVDLKRLDSIRAVDTERWWCTEAGVG